MMWLLAHLACTDEPAKDSALVCEPGADYDGTTAFVEASAAWGLEDLAATGVRIDAVDVDDDGWPDLFVRKGNGVSGGNTWVLRNTGEKSFTALEVPAGRDGLRDGATWVFADVDGDGDLDAYSGLVDQNGDYSETSEILLGNGDGTFTLTDDDNGVRTGAGDMPYGAAFTDFDRDGHVDLFVGQYDYQQSRLYKGNGTGDFDDVTNDVGLKTKRWTSENLNAGDAHPLAWSAAACDLNNDGYPELLASSYGRSPNHLWRNDAGTLVARGVDSNYAWDHRQDWTTNENARCWCKHNPTDTDCEGVPEPELLSCNSDSGLRWNHDTDRDLYRLGGNSGATVCRDVDNDGWADLLTTEIVHWDVGDTSDPSELLFNTQDPDVTFERPGNEVTGLVREHEITAWNDGDITASLFDFDNDGWTDVWIGSSDYEATRGLLWRQTAPRQFEAVPTDVGVDHERSHGSALADFDRDGDLDLVVGHSSARCDGQCYDSFHVRLWENQLGGGNDWVQLDLRTDVGSNSRAIGARVEVTADGLTQVQQVGGGHGQWGNQDDLVLHFGLGDACTADVEITWPDGAVTEHQVTGGQLVRLDQK
ncbi:MAG: CRTAC1 family protein [Proteobacteria bacterium]|nr:CRTAC1 family protein [Pseudomonadota bacterium]MCP4916772.1 CRTAC1 family protein [Pseudomonadota bacterium]